MNSPPEPLGTIAHILQRDWDLSPSYAEGLAEVLIEALKQKGFTIQKAEES